MSNDYVIFKKMTKQNLNLKSHESRAALFVAYFAREPRSGSRANFFGGDGNLATKMRHKKFFLKVAKLPVSTPPGRLAALWGV